MRRRRCALCPHKEYLHDDDRTPTGMCMVEGCIEHTFVDAAAGQMDIFAGVA